MSGSVSSEVTTYNSNTAGSVNSEVITYSSNMTGSVRSEVTTYNSNTAGSFNSEVTTYSSNTTVSVSSRKKYQTGSKITIEINRRKLNPESYGHGKTPRKTSYKRTCQAKKDQTLADQATEHIE
jgi:hypothetical protein